MMEREEAGVFSCVVEQHVYQHVVCETRNGRVFFVFTHTGGKHQTAIPADEHLELLQHVRRHHDQGTTP